MKTLKPLRIVGAGDLPNALALGRLAQLKDVERLGPTSEVLTGLSDTMRSQSSRL
jgi:hypothetical protein